MIIGKLHRGIMRMLLNNGVRLFKPDLILGHPKVEYKSNN